ncbi:heterokaryon incompatibility protein-domain-containing protein [Ilyonectria destructans]|nr:heterokaryon incompatibility protein-domain-containing protein [Ilyonectria destructans]
MSAYSAPHALEAPPLHRVHFSATHLLIIASRQPRDKSIRNWESRTLCLLHGTMESDAKFCGPCTRLDVLGSITQLASLGDLSERTPMPQDSPWHENLGAVNESATSCALCALAIKGWRESREIVVDQGLKSGDFDLQNPPEDLLFDIMDIDAYRPVGAGAVTLKIGYQAREGVDSEETRGVFFLCAKCEAVGSTGSWEAHDALVADFRVSFDPDAVIERDTQLGEIVNEVQLSHSSGKFLDELVARDPLSQRSLKIANHWLDTCVKTHGESCGNMPGESMPTRVLDIAPDGAPDGEKIYLRVSRDTKPEDGRYVALSHCWGKSDTPFTTTMSNLQHRLDGIDIEEMPQTFRDAVKVVRSLGLRYLWIDSLCIIQQDLEDWQIESAKMANVYRDAYLVLGAAAGLSDASGFLGPRNFQDIIRLQTNPSKLLYLQLHPPKSRRWTFEDRHAPDPLAAEPLTGRAWCLQERYLPKRALQYGSHQMFWECERIKASEDGDTVTQNGDYLKSLSDTGAVKESVFCRENREPYSENVSVKWVDWYQMLEDYTSRGITASMDKLPAVSGLASAIAKANGAEGYMAGIWRTGLLEGLVWCRKAPEQMFDKSDEYVAPSWSWASVQGAVQFPVYNWHIPRAPWKSRMADFEALAHYVSHTAELKDKDLYGRLERASLCIKAPLVKVMSIHPRPSEPPSVKHIFGQGPNRSLVADKVVELQSPRGERFWLDGGFDFPVGENHLDLAVVFLTRLPHILEDGFVEHRFGLLVHKLDAGDYRRVGFVDGSILETRHAATLRHMPNLVRKVDVIDISISMVQNRDNTNTDFSPMQVRPGEPASHVSCYLD